MKVKAFGTFKALNSNIFRINASLRFGNSDKPIGLIVMLNPGSSKLADENNWNNFLLDSETGKEITKTGDLWLDPTMESIIEIFKNIDPKLQGILHIYNLFNYRCGNSGEAIRAYTSILEDSQYTSLLHSPFPNGLSFPWVWTAWSVEDKVVLNRRKQEVLQNINKNGNKKLALYSRQKKHQKKREYCCYHPCPQKKETKDWVHSEIIKGFKEFYSLGNISSQ